MFKIRGKIVFTCDVPKSLPDGSTLVVKYNDTSRMDAPSITLGECVKTIKGYKHGDVIDFEISSDKKAETPYGSTLSACLNVGWKPSGDEWIRQGDYLNDTSHSISIIDGTDEYVKDIEVIHYK